MAEIVHLKNRHGRTVEVNTDHAARLLQSGAYQRAEPPAPPPDAEPTAEPPADKKAADKKPR